MKRNLIYYTLTIITSFLLLTCETKSTNNSDSNKNTTKFPDNHFPKKDTFQLKESLVEEDILVNEYLTQELSPIRDNFKRINSISKWTSIITQELWETLEGGDARFYYQKDKLEKIITQEYGETYQKLTEYYFLDEKLSFVFEKTYRYNRPFYQDSTSMKEIGDDDFFDFDKSTIIEDRSYFINGNLAHQISNQDCGAPFSKDYLIQEQVRILEIFQKLAQLENEN